ncbi:MAG TPA: helix-turn-helix transcriptional regulator [Candidatus Kapabacteria bacterium]|nr:helix-turn-helix transcriptional regulator [Candidatus Kapabacteria bacterium]
MSKAPTTTGGRMRTFGETVYNSVKEFAEAVKMAPPNLQKYMNDDREPGSGVLRKLYALGCNVNWLLTGQGDMFADNDPGRALLNHPRVRGMVTEPGHLYISGRAEDGEYEFTLRIKIKGKKISVSEVK